MLLRSVLWVFVFGILDAYRPDDCIVPHLSYGRSRYRPRSKLIRFMCHSGFDLVGNKYAICRNGAWDVPPPICIRDGCTPLNEVQHGLTIPSHDGAWLMFFCKAGYELIGSPALYCDGSKWNGTTPRCQASELSEPALSCDFEEANLCGWVQDPSHDFDWARLNKKTPSSNLFTGPQYDHTYGENGTGHFMFIESTGRLPNETARLFSPLYAANYSKNTVFTFYYHMYGASIGGLKIYQKPDSVSLMTSNKNKYVIFEKWGDQGNFWYNGEAQLQGLDEDFQIVIEGIRGTSFTSDIAIDDVSISVMKFTAVPYNIPSCLNRCDEEEPPHAAVCGCNDSCIGLGKCCPDYFDVCQIFGSTSDTTSETTSEEPKTTQKLTTTETTTTTANITRPWRRKTMVFHPVTRKTPQLNTTKIPTLVYKSSTVIYNINQNSTTKADVTTKATTISRYGVSRSIENHNEYHILVEKAKKEQEKKIEEAGKTGAAKVIVTRQSAGQSNIRNGFITLACLVLGGAIVVLLLAGRSARGREILSKLRGRTIDDQEVRFLTSNVEED